MSWGTRFNASIYISAKKYYSMDELDCAISQSESNIQTYRSRIIMLSLSDPNILYTHGGDICPADEIWERTSDLLDALDEETVLYYTLIQYRESILKGWAKLAERGDEL